MKKILIISYYYPPANFVGSERIASFAKHLYKFGVYPIIITRNWNPNQTNTYEKVLDNEFKHRIYKTYEEFYMPYIKSLRDKLFRYNGFVLSKVRRLLTIVEIIHSRFDLNALPYTNLYTQARNILKNDQEISVVIISGSPFEAFQFGYKLKKEFSHISWIPDYRDEWTSFKRYPSNSIIQSLVFKLDTRIEKKYTSNATAFITVADYWVESIKNHIKKPGFKVMNGFEPKNLTINEPNLEKSKFIISQ